MATQIIKPPKQPVPPTCGICVFWLSYQNRHRRTGHKCELSGLSTLSCRSACQYFRSIHAQGETPV